MDPSKFENLPKLDHTQIQILANDTNTNSVAINSLLENNIYNNGQRWKTFFKIALLVFAIGFTVLGTLFFFAYNWASLHKFIKFGIIGSLILIGVIIAVVQKDKPIIQNIAITGTAVLVGVLFAVYGQTYQTGADTFDLFLVWTLAILIWVIAMDFKPLWLLFVLLTNTTYILYNDQMTRNSDSLESIYILFAINYIFALFFYIKALVAKTKLNDWLQKISTLIAVVIGGFAIATTIHSSSSDISNLIPIITFGLIVLSIFFGYQQKDTFYIILGAIAVIAIITSLIMYILDDINTYIILSFFILGITSIVVFYILKLQKNWDSNEK